MSARKNTTKNFNRRSATVGPGGAGGPRPHTGEQQRLNKRVDITIPERLHEAIEKERGRLLKADSLLGCMMIAMESDVEAEMEHQPSYPDVAQMARELLRQAVDGLDLVSLRQRLSGTKIKEDPAVPVFDPIELPAEIAAWESLEVTPTRAIYRRKSRNLRLHRRHYRVRHIETSVLGELRNPTA